MSGGQRVLVTGAAGLLGRRLVVRLEAEGWLVRSMVHRSSVDAGHERVTASLGNTSSLVRAASGVDAVVHLAAITHSRNPKAYHRVNAVGTRNLLAAIGEAGVDRFVFVSTRAIGTAGGAYSRSKAEAEEAVRSSGLDYVIVRLPEVYGMASREGIDRLIALAQRGAWVPMVGGGDTLLCPAHVDDVVPACVRALGAAEAVGHTYTLAGPCLTMRELAGIAADVAGQPSRMMSIPVPAFSALTTISRVIPLPIYPDQLARLRSPKPPLSPEARIHLSFNPRPLRDGLAEFHARADGRGR